MTIEEVKSAIKGVLDAQTIEIRIQKLDYLLDNVPFDRTRIEEIERDIEELRMEAHNLDSKFAIHSIQEIIRKYKL